MNYLIHIEYHIINLNLNLNKLFGYIRDHKNLQSIQYTNIPIRKFL